MTEERTEYRVPVFSPRGAEHYHMWALGLKTALSGKKLLEVITALEVSININRKAFSSLILSSDDYPLRAVQSYELVKNKSNRLQEKYV